LRYLLNAYGEMADGLNAGDPSDRFVVQWPVLPPSPPPAASDANGADVVLACGDDGEPLPGAPTGAAVRTAWIPEDIVALRRREPALAHGWRLALRDALTAAEADGFIATAMTRGGWYVLERRP
jgi:predicted GNAT superfamily acetyltransferase